MALLSFPSIGIEDPDSLVRTLEHQVDESGQTLSGLAQVDAWSTTPIVTIERTVVLRSNVQASGAWGTLPEPAAADWFIRQVTGSVGRFLYTDPVLGTSFTASFGDPGQGFQQHRGIPGLWSWSYEVRTRKG